MGPYRIWYRIKCTICERKRPQKENVAIDRRKSDEQYVENVCMYVALFRLYSGISSQTAHHRARPRGRRKGNVPFAHRLVWAVTEQEQCAHPPTLHRFGLSSYNSRGANLACNMLVGWQVGAAKFGCLRPESGEASTCQLKVLKKGRNCK